jgi:hypothetical protein
LRDEIRCTGIIGSRMADHSAVNLPVKPTSARAAESAARRHPGDRRCSMPQLA